MKNLRILIIDTDLFSLSKLYFGLIHGDYTVEACNTVEEVPARVKRFQPDLVVLGHTGTTDQTALGSYLKAMGVHLLLAGAPPGKVSDYLAAEENIAKPVDLDLLRRKISDLAVKK